MRILTEHPPLIGVPTWCDISTRYGGVPLYGMNQSYVRALHQTGALAVLIPLELPEWELYEILGRVDGLFLAGGSDIGRAGVEAGQSYVDEQRDRVELALARRSLDAGMPVLGVCRGMQLLNVACGGTLHRDLATDRPEAHKHDYFPPEHARNRISHPVEIMEGSYLHTLFGSRAEVNSMHHQGIDTLGSGIRMVAMAPDGVPEAIVVDGHPFALGVQWHPEELFSVRDGHAALFRHFARHAREHAAASLHADAAAKMKAWLSSLNANRSLPTYAVPAA